MNKTKRNAVLLALGVIILAAGLAAAAVSVSSRIGSLLDVKEFEDDSYLREGGKYSTDFGNYLVIVPGEVTYDESGASDIIFGVTVDSPLLVRVSEMYQWLPSGSGFEKGWSGELIDTGDDDHKNPASYASSTGTDTFSAPSVMIGGFRVSDDQLEQLKERESLKTLPEIDVKGFHTSGEYLTNAEDINSPEIGDVRIRYEYVTSKNITITGVQRDGDAREWVAEHGTSFSLAFDGALTKAETIAEYRRRAEPVVWWLLLLGAAASVGGALLAMAEFSALTGYKATVTLQLGKKKKLALEGARAAAIYAALLGIFLFGVTLAAMWASLLPLGLLVSIVVLLIYAYILVPNVMKNTPKRVKKEKPYVPIIKKRDENDIGKKR